MPGVGGGPESRPQWARPCLASFASIAPSATGATLGASLLQDFRCAFDGCAGEPTRCLTGVVARFRRHQHALTPATVAEIERFLAPRTEPSPGCSFTHFSPSGRFEFTYETCGCDSVPVEDIDPPNGIPDFVERCAEYADFSWASIVDSLAFTAPLLPPDGSYDITFRNLGLGFYGFADTSGATTTIVLHRNFWGPGWGQNDDPDGSQLGRAKVTIAHELKHASQYTTSAWTEGLWIELDAMWVEDLVYPATNDYHLFLTNVSGSQLDAAWIRIDNDPGDEGSYEDCLWQHYLSGTHGNTVINDLWDRRALFPAEPMKDSYAAIMAAHSTSWKAAYPAYLEWCWFTGARADSSIGFPDAPDLWKMELYTQGTAMYPATVMADVDRLAGHPLRFNRGSATGHPRVRFDGDDDHPDFVVSIIAEELNDNFTIVHPPLDASNDFDYVVPLKFQELRYVMVLVTNTAATGEEKHYSVTVIDDTTVDAPLPGALTERLALDRPAPNPARGRTRIRWHAPASEAVTVTIHDVAGRIVRTLVRSAESVSGKPSQASWDGTNDSGTPVAGGVYWVRAASRSASAARPVTVLR